MENIEKLNNPQPEKSEESEEKPEEQTIEGFIGEYQDWQKKLPPNIKPEMVDLFLGSDGLWHWHLRPEYIQDEQERKKYEMKRSQW
ncbi:hypothetical protein COW77_00360 [Candidatus Wolfebacteria bacterium CG18_big_fil_WC_8_21_14_2_50_39_7]|uniref:Uncharacterized protein n=3 Tax=Candidatus Wolfeibacteriota TaxID=1752735 RepID=A0A2M7Q5W2_9BACT|nr:hypothetical protein [Parcubacteria group bacterium]NCO89593.1 hypothetical protein [Candidatus Wolfebacteria bacterium]OIO65793.1 MAG: hypothetical protein AUJ30_00420 [Candidatus Wolfebacteria bacterium CG1_02_39_135]PIP92359.1 MAG: hypothetical protein COW77_00360 [Candidatus Wolfebacteria bacterium CG18_big_fil_WC_8_21_14_2_50_39_7]PIY58826.1 MAG: hypothetical protein COY97_02165 [Candidatus Wolfebacteria bacterium CG_4_10_14_0_8_um_filter_39_64]